MANAGSIPGFVGAFFHGSINSLPDDALLPATSDVDVMVVLEAIEPPHKPGKFFFRNVLLEVSSLPHDQVRTPELVLAQYNLAGSFRTPSVILDPSGELTRLQAAVARDFANRRWVVARCAQARDKVLGGFTLRAGDPFPDQVVAWLFPAGITTHVLLAAGLRNPTVRQRYLAVRDLLADYGRLDFYETLLELLGCAGMSRARVEQRLVALADAFDAAKTVVSTPFFFASDISDVARPIAIDGSRELIERGFHREAVFWMVAAYSRCQMVFHHDAPELNEQSEPGYRDLLGDLGMASFNDLQRGLAEVKRSLPQIWQVAEEIMAANPEIED